MRASGGVQRGEGEQCAGRHRGRRWGWGEEGGGQARACVPAEAYPRVCEGSARHEPLLPRTVPVLQCHQVAPQIAIRCGVVVEVAVVIEVMHRCLLAAWIGTLHVTHPRLLEGAAREYRVPDAVLAHRAIQALEALTLLHVVEVMAVRIQDSLVGHQCIQGGGARLFDALAARNTFLTVRRRANAARRAWRSCTTLRCATALRSREMRARAKDECGYWVGFCMGARGTTSSTREHAGLTRGRGRVLVGGVDRAIASRHCHCLRGSGETRRRVSVGNSKRNSISLSGFSGPHLSESAQKLRTLLQAP